jgi:hypothetical protein
VRLNNTDLLYARGLLKDLCALHKNNEHFSEESREHILSELEIETQRFTRHTKFLTKTNRHLQGVTTLLRWYHQHFMTRR